jgi:hypothetical protein
MKGIEERNTGIPMLPILFAYEINIKFNSMFFFFDENFSNNPEQTIGLRNRVIFSDSLLSV